VKFKASYGSSPLPSIVAQIETELEVVLGNGIPALPPRGDLVHSLGVRAPYLETIEKLVDWGRLRDAGTASSWTRCMAPPAACCANC